MTIGGIAIHVHGHDYDGSQPPPPHEQALGIFSPGHGDRQMGLGDLSGASGPVLDLEMFERPGTADVLNHLLSLGFRRV